MLNRKIRNDIVKILEKSWKSKSHEGNTLNNVINIKYFQTSRYFVSTCRRSSLEFNKKLTRRDFLKLKTIHKYFFLHIRQSSMLCFFPFSFSRIPVKSRCSYGDVTIAGEGLQILTYAKHLWPLNRVF